MNAASADRDLLNDPSGYGSDDGAWYAESADGVPTQADAHWGGVEDDAAWSAGLWSETVWGEAALRADDPDAEPTQQADPDPSFADPELALAAPMLATTALWRPASWRFGFWPETTRRFARPDTDHAARLALRAPIASKPVSTWFLTPPPLAPQPSLSQTLATAALWPKAGGLVARPCDIAPEQPVAAPVRVSTALWRPASGPSGSWPEAARRFPRPETDHATRLALRAPVASKPIATWFLTARPLAPMPPLPWVLDAAARWPEASRPLGRRRDAADAADAAHGAQPDDPSIWPSARRARPEVSEGALLRPSLRVIGAQFVEVTPAQPILAPARPLRPAAPAPRLSGPRLGVGPLWSEFSRRFSPKPVVADRVETLRVLRKRPRPGDVAAPSSLAIGALFDALATEQEAVATVHRAQALRRFTTPEAPPAGQSVRPLLRQLAREVRDEAGRGRDQAARKSRFGTDAIAAPAPTGRRAS